MSHAITKSASAGNFAAGDRRAGFAVGARRPVERTGCRVTIGGAVYFVAQFVPGIRPQYLRH